MDAVLRRLVAGLAAAALAAEGVLLALVHFVLGRTTHNQSMSIAGSDPEVMAVGTYVLGAALGGFLLLCAVLLAVAAVRDRAPGRFARVVLITAAVAHGLLGALAVSAVGWGAFAVTMAILCLIVLALTLHPARDGRVDGRVDGLQEAAGGFRPTSR
ncbi:hypothetical protein [Streptomyces sp. BR123]|uniref:hypothetical protein n=1 Tax=Streptomyces sp. BR123 TaxID=2749828 RepID=UPI00281148FD|nr:hypothetical protein [Streptomyces sp. BR123]